MKRCSGCGVEKDDSEFHRWREKLRSRCKACRSASGKEYNSRPEVKARGAAQYQQWRTNNRERVKESLALWHERNRDRRNAEARANYAKMCAEHPASQMVDRARSRAKKMGIPFDLTVGDILIPDVCPVLGIPLRFRRGAKGAGPNSPSLDRFDTSKGYTKDNVVVVSHRANTLKNNATRDEIERVAAYMRSTPPTIARVLNRCEAGEPIGDLVAFAGGKSKRKRWRQVPDEQMPLL